MIGENDWQESATDYDALKSDEGIAAMAAVVDGFGPWINQIAKKGAGGEPVSTGLAERIHAADREVHPYTLRRDDLPAAFDSFEEAVRFLREELRVDAVFTDFPDLF